jgi:hypothetical protein
MLTFENSKKTAFSVSENETLFNLNQKCSIFAAKVCFVFSSKVLLPLNMSKNVFSQLRSLGVGTAKVQKCSFLEGIPLLFVTFRSLSE